MNLLVSDGVAAAVGDGAAGPKACGAGVGAGEAPACCTVRSEAAPVALPAPPLVRSSRVALLALGAGAAAVPALCELPPSDATSAEAMNRNRAAPLAIVDRVRSGATQIGIETRGTSERLGTSMGRAEIRRAVERSSARRARHKAHDARCASTLARASGPSAPSRYAESSANGCTALISYP